MGFTLKEIEDDEVIDMRSSSLLRFNVNRSLEPLQEFLPIYLEDEIGLRFLDIEDQLWYLNENSMPELSGLTGEVQFNEEGGLSSSPNLFWDNVNKNLGIGTTTPTSNLHLARTETATQDSVAKFLSTQTTSSSDNN
jgi:hypothetical protein